MANYGDFNFGDDTPSPDTDPVPDNSIPETESSSDGKQNDVANYPEPGEGDTSKSGDPTEFSVYGNAEEPGAQQDHSAPVINTPQRPNSVPSNPYTNNYDVVEQTAKSAPVEDQVNEDPFIDKLRKAGYPEIHYSNTNFYNLIDKLRKAGYEDGEIDYSNTNFDNFIEKLKKAGFDDGEIDYSDTNFDNFIEKLKKAGFDDGEIDFSDTNFDNFIDKLLKAGFNDGEIDYTDTNFDNFIDKLKRAGFDDNEIDYSNTNFDNFIDKLREAGFETLNESVYRINSTTGRLFDNIGIGDFEKLVYDHFGDHISLDDELNIVDELEGLEQLDVLNVIQFVDTIDLNDYLGDITQDSNLIEFQVSDGMF